MLKMVAANDDTVMDLLEKYIHEHSSAEDSLLHELDRQTHLRVLNPRMISGHIQGKLLELIVKMFRPKNVLEIGTGSGYQTACLVAFGVDVYSIARQKALYDITSALFQRLDIRVNNICGDGYLGMPEHAPFDKIIVTAGAFQFPPKLMAQLKVGGMMIIPVEDKSGVSNM